MFTYLLIGLTALVSWFCFSNQTLFLKLALVPYRVAQNKEWYRVVTHGFVHADMMHLFVNLFTFWSFGTYIEQTFGMLGYGAGAFAGLYFGGMVVASISDLVKRRRDPYYLSIGASGAVSAVLFSYILFKPLGMIYFFAVLPVPAVLFGVLYLVYCQYMGKRGGDNINHNAHFYGAIYGFLYPLLLDPSLIRAFIHGFGF